MRVVHVDSAHEWRGSQSQVLLTAQEMSRRGHEVAIACRVGGGLEARARAAGLDVRSLVFGGDLRPVVATATGGVPEVVRHRDTGILVPVGDSGALTNALVSLLADERRRKRMGRAGRKRFERHFTAARMVDETLRVYEELTASRPANGFSERDADAA
jgi:glycosyltransferase involved in cell wall biosynthesis